MRKFVSVIIIFVLLIQGGSPLFAQQQKKISIAIVDFQNTSQKQDLDYLQNALPEMLITSMAKSGKLDIVERSRLQDAINEMQLGMTGIVDQGRAVELGKAVGANAIMVGSFLEIEGLIRINSRLIDVESSKVLKAESVQGRSGREIFDLMDELAKSIEDQLLGEKPGITPTTQTGLTEEEEPPTTTTTTTTTTGPQVREDKGGSNAIWYVLGGAALIGGGAAAYLLLSGDGDGNGDGDNNSTVTITVTIP